LVDIGLAFPLL